MDSGELHEYSALALGATGALVATDGETQAGAGGALMISRHSADLTDDRRFFSISNDVGLDYDVLLGETGGNALHYGAKSTFLYGRRLGQKELIPGCHPFAGIRADMGYEAMSLAAGSVSVGDTSLILPGAAGAAGLRCRAGNWDLVGGAALGGALDAADALYGEGVDSLGFTARAFGEAHLKERVHASIEAGTRIEPDSSVTGGSAMVFVQPVREGKFAIGAGGGVDRVRDSDGDVGTAATVRAGAGVVF